MKFEKPKAEVVYFNSQTIFTRSSSGTTCWYFGIIETLDGSRHACYDVSPDGHNYDTGTQYVRCGNIESLMPGRIEIMTDPEYHYGATIP